MWVFRYLPVRAAHFKRRALSWTGAAWRERTPCMAKKVRGNRSKKKLKSRAKAKRGVLKRGRVRRRKARGKKK
jgi:hypothetical protein